MDTDTAVKTIKEHILKEGETLSWWDKQKKKDVKKLGKALKVFKEKGRITGDYRERRFNFVSMLLELLGEYYDGKITKEKIHDIIAEKTEFKNIYIGKIKDEQVNEHLLRIASWFDKEAEVHAPIGLTKQPGEKFTVCMPGCNCCCAVLGGGGIAVYSDEYERVKKELGPLDESTGATMDLGGWEGAMIPKHYKERIVAYLPATKKVLPEARDIKDHGLIYFDEKNLHACNFLGSYDEKEWNKLAERFKILIKRFHPEFDFSAAYPGSFQGGFCSVYDKRPKECKDTECRYSIGIIPEMLEKAPSLIVEMLRTEKLIDRYKIAEDYLRKG